MPRTTTQTFSTFAELGQHLADQRTQAAQTINREDVRRASNLRRSRSLATNRAPGIGPRVAR